MSNLKSLRANLLCVPALETGLNEALTPVPERVLDPITEAYIKQKAEEKRLRKQMRNKQHAKA